MDNKSVEEMLVEGTSLHTGHGEAIILNVKQIMQVSRAYAYVSLQFARRCRGLRQNLSEIVIIPPCLERLCRKYFLVTNEVSRSRSVKR